MDQPISSVGLNCDQPDTCASLYTDREVRRINAKTCVAIVIPVGEGESSQRWFRAQLAQSVQQHSLWTLPPHGDNATEGYDVKLSAVATNVNSEYVVLTFDGKDRSVVKVGIADVGNE